MTITVRKEPLPSIEEALTVAVEHFDEIAENKSELPFDPDYFHYVRLQEAGALHCVVVRHDGKLIGYWGLIVQKHPHSQATKVALGDMYFLAAKYRGQGIGREMLQCAMAVAKQAGAKVFITREKLAHPHDALFADHGFREFERAYCRPL